MNMHWILFWAGLAAIPIAALAATGTLLHNVGIAVDVFLQCLGWNKITCLTLSSRAGLAARAGHAAWSYVIGILFLSWRDPLLHCERAMVADRDRTCDGLEALYPTNRGAQALIKMLRSIPP